MPVDAIADPRRVFETLISNVPGFAYRCRNDRSWTVEFLSDGFRAVTGYEVADVLSGKLTLGDDVILEEDRAPVWEKVQAALAERRSFELSYRMVTKSGEHRHAWEHGCGVWNDAGELVALEGLVVDVTERKRLEESLARARKMEAVGHLAAGVAHDVNNVVCVMMSLSSLLVDELAADDPRRARADAILSAAYRAARITRQLLVFTRGQVCTPQLLDLNAVISDAIPLLRGIAGAHVDLRVDLDDNAGATFADQAQLEQVLLNLVANARDAMPEGGRVRLSTHKVDERESAGDGPWIVLSVEDQGTGMDEETRRRAFDPFFTTKAGGTGLGLAIVREVVDQNGGHLDLKPAPERGTIFEVWLRRSGSAPRKKSADASWTPVIGVDRRVVLLVEDEAVLRNVMTEVLTNAGYQVLVARDGEQALRFAATRSDIALLLTDDLLPGSHGSRLATRIRALLPGIRVLVVSGATFDAVTHGDYDLLAKPFTPAALLAKVAEALARDERARKTGS